LPNHLATAPTIGSAPPLARDFALTRGTYTKGRGEESATPPEIGGAGVTLAGARAARFWW